MSCVVGEPVPAPEPVAGHRGDQLRRLAGLGEHQRLHVGGDEGGQQVAALAQQRPAGAEVDVGEGRLPQAEVHRAARGAVDGDLGDRRPDQPAGVLARVADGGRREQELRVGVVALAQPPQPAQDQGDVAAEHAPRDVGLVHDHVPQPVQQVAPPGVAGQQRVVQQVGVGQDPVGGAPDRVAFGAVGVPVDDRGADLRQLQRPHRPQLVAGQRLGRGEVDGRGGVVGEDRFDHRQLVGERLARRGPGRHDDVLAGTDAVAHLGLVQVEPVDARHLEPGPQQRREVVGQRHRAGLAGGHPREVGQPLVVGGVPAGAVVGRAVAGPPGGPGPGDELEDVTRVEDRLSPRPRARTAARPRARPRRG